VDASGFRAPVARKLGLREEPTRLKHDARSIWTHMVGVDRLDGHLKVSRRDTPITRENTPYPGLWSPDNEGFKQVFDDMVQFLPERGRARHPWRGRPRSGC
jgi:hypothetical protein